MTGPSLSRRDLLKAGAGVAIGAGAGCIESRSPFAPPMVEDRPPAVYVPSHFEEMTPLGTSSSGPLSATLLYSYPHRFWLVSGTDRSRVKIKADDAIHLMVAIWDSETDQVLFGSNPKVVVRKDDALVDERFFWPMLSQPMGFHYGDNLPLDGDGHYTFTVTVPPTGLDVGHELAGRIDRSATFEFDFEWKRAMLEDLQIHTVEDGRKGTRGALSPMTMGPAPLSTAPETLPGTALGTKASDEITLQASLQQGDGSAPAVSLVASTPHNRYSVPNIGMQATVDSADPIPVRQAMSASEGLHYRLEHPSLATGETLRVDLLAEPQVARHEGYETAFTDFGAVEFALQ